MEIIGIVFIVFFIYLGFWVLKIGIFISKILFDGCMVTLGCLVWIILAIFLIGLLMMI